MFSFHLSACLGCKHKWWKQENFFLFLWPQSCIRMQSAKMPYLLMMTSGRLFAGSTELLKTNLVSPCLDYAVCCVCWWKFIHIHTYICQLYLSLNHCFMVILHTQLFLHKFCICLPLLFLFFKMSMCRWVLILLPSLLYVFFFFPPTGVMKTKF